MRRRMTSFRFALPPAVALVACAAISADVDLAEAMAGNLGVRVQWVKSANSFEGHAWATVISERRADAREPV